MREHRDIASLSAAAKGGGREMSFVLHIAGMHRRRRSTMAGDAAIVTEGDPAAP